MCSWEAASGLYLRIYNSILHPNFTLALPKSGVLDVLESKTIFICAADNFFESSTTGRFSNL
jgi:hypothetical protein